MASRGIQEAIPELDEKDPDSNQQNDAQATIDIQKDEKPRPSQIFPTPAPMQNTNMNTGSPVAEEVDKLYELAMAVNTRRNMNYKRELCMFCRSELVCTPVRKIDTYLERYARGISRFIRYFDTFAPSCSCTDMTNTLASLRRRSGYI